MAVQSWDLAVDPDYAARTVKQMQAVELESPKIVFLDNKTIAVTYSDGKGANSSDYTQRKIPSSPLYKFHALIFDVNEGPGTAKKLAWEAAREQAQLLPTQEGEFAVRVDDHVMIYSRDFQLQREMKQPYYGNRPLPTGEPFFSEMYFLGVSQTGKSLAICHVLRGRHHSGGTQLSLYDTKSLKQIGQTSDLNLNAAGCYKGFNVTDHAVYSGYYVFQPEAGSWRAINPKCINCDARPPTDEISSQDVGYDLFDETHVLVYDDIVDLDGREIYKISPDKGARVDRPDNYFPMPHAANAPRCAYDDGQPTGVRGHKFSQKVHVVDWSQGRKLATIKVVQDRLPVRHQGGFQLERLSFTDFTYALSPDGTKLAVLSLNSVKIYHLP